MPNVMMNANSEIMLIDTSVTGKNSSEPQNEIGMPSVTQKARRPSRNRPRVSSTRMRPIRALLIRRSRRPSYISAVSNQVAALSPAGSSS